MHDAVNAKRSRHRLAIVYRYDAETIANRISPAEGVATIRVRALVSVSSMIVSSAADIAAVLAISMPSPRIDWDIAVASVTVTVPIRHGALRW